MNTGKMKNPANHTISRVLIRLGRRFVVVAGLPAAILKGVGAQEHPSPGYRLFVFFVFTP
jgi:hypothetical protein